MVVLFFQHYLSEITTITIITPHLDNLRQMAEKLMDEIREIQVMKQSQENELATIENAALRQRFRLTLDKLEAKEQEKREEVIMEFLCICIQFNTNHVFYFDF